MGVVEWGEFDGGVSEWAVGVSGTAGLNGCSWVRRIGWWSFMVSVSEQMGIRVPGVRKGVVG